MESFETDGEGTRYNSNTFDETPANCNFLIRTNTQSACHGDPISGLDGSYYFASEDVKGGLGGPIPGEVLFQPFIATGLTGLTVDILLAVSNNALGDRFELNDAILIQYNFDGGSWATIGAFYGDAQFGGHMREDADLNGVADPAGTYLTSTAQNFSFNIPGTGTNLHIRVVLDQLGGTEEIVFDKISVSGTSAGFTLPFLETWENNNGVIDTDGNIYSDAGFSWDFETDNQGEGQASFGTDAHAAYEGSGALTLDKFPSNGTFATNCAILTLDLSAFTSSTDLSLSFRWASHKDEEHAEDKVWIRGSDSDAWVEAYDLDPASVPNHIYQLVTGVDIDATLAGASQTVSSTFQVKLGQKDNSFAPGDGISFDNIAVEEIRCLAPSELEACNVRASSFTLGWTENGVATAWQVRIGAAGFDTTGSGGANVGNNPVNVSGATPATAYDFYVRANCGSGEFSEWVGPYTLLTAPVNISQATLPFTEDFESSNGDRNTDGHLFAGSSHFWSFETNKQGIGYASWGTNAFLANQGSGALSMDKYPSSSESAINCGILTINMSAFLASTELELSFWWADHRDAEQQVTAAIYNMSGELVETLQDGLLTEGGHRIVWNGKNRFGQDVPQGIYILRLINGDSVVQKTIVRTK